MGIYAMKCRHCGRDKVNRPRGLCWTCYYTPGVRAMFPVTSKYGEKAVRVDTDEPTEAELDAMIAEQLPTMPKE